MIAGDGSVAPGLYANEPTNWFASGITPGGGAVRCGRLGGGLGGHNGLRSIAQHLKTQDFLRLRIGVGRPERGDNTFDGCSSHACAPER